MTAKRLREIRSLTKIEITEEQLDALGTNRERHNKARGLMICFLDYIDELQAEVLIRGGVTYKQIVNELEYRGNNCPKDDLSEKEVCLLDCKRRWEDNLLEFSCNDLTRMADIYEKRGFDNNDSDTPKSI